MDRRNFLMTSSTAAIALAAARAGAPPLSAATGATILFDGRSTALDQTRVSGDGLWVRASDLPRINQFEVKPQGACRADICVPLSKSLKKGDWFNLTGFAGKLGQAFVADAGVWSFAEIPAVRGGFYESRIAPEFAVPDRAGRLAHLSDFRGKKTLVITWASW